MNDTPAVLTVAEVAGILRISKDLAYELIDRGDLPALKLGRRRDVPTRAVIELLGAIPEVPDSPATEAETEERRARTPQRRPGPPRPVDTPQNDVAS